jgi:hypothetical protein
MSSSGHRDTPPPRTGADEKSVLLGFLNYLRASAMNKVRGAPEPQVRNPSLVPSGTNPLGLIKHLAHVERHWFLGVEFEDWQRTFTADAADTVESLVADSADAVAQANAVIAECEDLSSQDWRPPGAKRTPSMRWALTHMIEETARHAGHLDILRELIDGTTGR